MSTYLPTFTTAEDSSPEATPRSRETTRSSSSQSTFGLRLSSQKTASSVSILMIGSTGNGKSTLGNFLIDPSDDHIWGQKQVFRTARTNMPETTIVKFATDRQNSIKIIDTPGLNESAEKDLSHMIHIVRKLKDLESITACILCVKFDSKIDAQYKATIAYYRKLLPSLFEGNVLIVMTNFQTDKRTMAMRKRQGVDVDAIVRNCQREVIESGKLTFTPQVFLIDSVPMSDEERTVSENCRLSILDFIQRSLKPILIKDMKVAKTTALKQYDDKEVGRLDGEIHGYNMRLKEANSAAEEVLNGIERKERNVTETKGDIQKIETELQDKCSSTRVTAQTWSIESSWKWFQGQSESFEVQSAWPVVDYSRWDNGHLTWKNFNVDKDHGRAKGQIEGGWFRGLYANLTLHTEKRLRYASEIKKLEENLGERKKRVVELQQDLDEYKTLHSSHQKEIHLLQEYIQKRNMTKELLLADPIPIDVADRRLQELKLVSV